MQHALLFLCLAAAGPQDAAPEPAPEAAVDVARHAFVELVAEPAVCFVGQPLRARIVLGLDADFLAERMIQPFRQELDVPVRLDAPWLAALPGAVRFEPGDRDDALAGGPTLALGQEVASARPAGERALDGRRFLLFAVERDFLPERAGGLVLPGATLSLAWTGGFREDALGGRVPVDRHDGAVRAAPVAVEVRPWPEEGRPPEFAGAVGRFAVRANTDRRTVRAGESFRLRLVVEGAGNLAALDVPRLPPLPGLAVRGRSAEPAPGGRAFVYDLAALAPGPALVPALPFAYLDPGPPPAYRTATSEEIALTVHAGEPGPAAPAPPPPAAGDGESWRLGLAIALAGALVAVLLVRAARAAGRA